MNKQPEITERTKSYIFEAYWKLRMKGEKLSVIKLSQTAGVNRSTFYEYFADLDELREEAENDMLRAVKTAINQAFPNGFPMSLKEFAHIYAGILEDKGERLFFVLSQDLNSRFMEKLKEFYTPIFMQLFGVDQDMPGFEYAVTFSASAVTGMASKWYKDGKPISLEDLLYNIYLLLSTGIFGFAQMKLYSEN